MASLTVRQLDERLKKLLRLRAARHGRSMEDEVRSILMRTSTALNVRDQRLPALVSTLVLWTSVRWRRSRR